MKFKKDNFVYSDNTSGLLMAVNEESDSATIFNINGWYESVKLSSLKKIDNIYEENFQISDKVISVNGLYGEVWSIQSMDSYAYIIMILPNGLYHKVFAAFLRKLSKEEYVQKVLEQ